MRNNQTKNHDPMVLGTGEYSLKTNMPLLILKHPVWILHRMRSLRSVR